MVKLMNKYKFKHSFSASYNPSSNGQAEAFNKVLCKIMKKIVTKNKREWHECLLAALWAYRTTVQIPSLRIATQLTDPDENVQVHLAELEALDEKQLAIQQKLKIYQAQLDSRNIQLVDSR
ncbi:uncharacterized protein LOC133033106 [Cannabis sativa]|uniref:uncharacterized protein LOC133033106 n=1 Tax=Cannabis sativa TaxID=3483 RepID=UPI0029C9C8F3|nr:uncharacterized protein LOC133033106 [Cannabis sativa]